MIGLVEKFSKDFFDEHKFKPMFRNIFHALEAGESPHKIIENLCVVLDETECKMLEILQNNPTKIIVSTERMEELKKDFKL